jgi:hypothetical protein
MQPSTSSIFPGQEAVFADAPLASATYQGI